MKNKKQNIIYPELSYLLTGIFFYTHNKLGRFLKEKQYCDFLEDLFKKYNLNYKREFEISKLNEDSI